MLQKATVLKARVHFKQQNVTGQLRRELQSPATATVDNSQRMQPKPRHRQPEPLAKVQTHSKLHLKLSVLQMVQRRNQICPKRLDQALLRSFANTQLKAFYTALLVLHFI